MIESLVQFGLLVRKQRESKGFTLDTVASLTGISKPYLSNIENARAPGPPSPEKLALLEQALSFPAGHLAAAADWLRTPPSIRTLLNAPRRPDGTLDLDAILAPSSNPTPSSTPTTDAPRPAQRPQTGARSSRFSVRQEGADSAPANQIPSASPMAIGPIPLINRVAAGRAREYTDLDYPLNVADDYVPAPLDPAGRTPQAAFALQIAGDSMEPDYHDGDLIIVGRQDPQDGDDCLVRLDESENFATTFKRVFFHPTAAAAGEATGEAGGEARGAEPPAPTHVRLVPLNPRHATRMVALTHITGLFPILWKLVPAGAGPKQK